MAKKKIVILGTTGMLGSMLLEVFSKEGGLETIGINRKRLDAEAAGVKEIVRAIKGAKWVINAIGITKPHIHEDSNYEIERAIKVNSLFPHLLAQASNKTGSKVIQITTDCVYTGRKGRYIETDLHDAVDVYGKTKSLGEVYEKNFYNFRCSIIGLESKGRNKFLLEWFLSQGKGAKLNGFTNHRWNGVTTLHFAKICAGIIKNDLKLPHIQYIVPKDSVSKADLLEIFSKEFKRRDIQIKRIKDKTSSDRTLSTSNKKLNARIWKLAGFKKPPTIRQMIKEMAGYRL